MFFGSRQFFALLFALACALPAAAQKNENLSALNIIQKSDAEIREILENSSETQLKAVCDSLIDQDDSPDFIKDFSARVRSMEFAQATAQKIKYAGGEQKALFRLGVIYWQNNQFERALEFFNRSLVIAERENDLKAQAAVLETLGYICRNRTDYDKALDYDYRALQIYEKLDDSRQTHMLDAIGAIYMYLGDYNRAEAAHRRALSINEALKIPHGIANSLFHLAIVNRHRGNYADALRLYQEAKQISDALAGEMPDVFPSATYRRHIGGTYFLQGNLRLALDYAGQALALDEKRSDLSGTAYSLQFISLVRAAEKNFQESKSLAERTVPMFEKVDDRDGLARSLALLGNIHLSLNETEKSLDYFQRALKLREASGSRDGMAIARIGIARGFLAQKKFSDALELAVKAVESTKENGNRELLWQAQSVVGQIYLAQNDCGKTRQAFDAAIGTIESLRGEIVGGASENSLFFAERIKPYQLVATMLAGQNDFAEAFEYAERAKARVLLDSIKFGRNQLSALMTAQEQQEENRLRGNVNSLNAQISRTDAADREKLSDLKTGLEAARTDLARFQTNLYAKYPELRIKRGAVKPVEIGEIGKLIDENSALLEYAIAADSILLFVFTKVGGKIEFKTYKIEVGREDLNRRIERFRRMLAERNVLFASESRALYETLLRPAAMQLAGKTSLTIVPDDGLWELPFQALQSAENRYVLDEASVSYSPSLTILRELRSNPRRTNLAAQKMLAFGNPVKSGAAFAALPEAEKQTLALQNLYGAPNTRIFNRADADESVLKSQTAAGFSILHLATHGVLDNTSPLNSFVLLAPNPTTGDDGRLEAWEILEMNLSSDLIFLSACETARGGVRSGEGLVGLAWSLMVAGGRSVVVSQWKVEAASTTEMTIDFYKNLKQNANKKPDALRRAALKLRRNPATAHPFYWAGFVLIGEGE